jgi:hypothetical protein
MGELFAQGCHVENPLLEDWSGTKHLRVGYRKNTAIFILHDADWQARMDNSLENLNGDHPPTNHENDS